MLGRWPDDLNVFFKSIAHLGHNIYNWITINNTKKCIFDTMYISEMEKISFRLTN